MKYALVCDRIWRVQNFNSLSIEVLITRKGLGTYVRICDLVFISPQAESDKIYRRAKPFIDDIDSFSDIDHILNIDGNDLLPFAEQFSIMDIELLDFLNETIELVDDRFSNRV